eukprot:m.1131747 g.1131747  ORF g.1131747 m.1131747 type:complete len:119 (+) comp24424_c3_seq52:1537-1893(+)
MVGCAAVLRTCHGHPRPAGECCCVPRVDKRACTPAAPCAPPPSPVCPAPQSRVPRPPGAVTQADFRHGFIKYAVQSPDLFFLSAQGVTFTQCLAAAQSFVNDKIVQLCKEFYAVLTPP